MCERCIFKELEPLVVKASYDGKLPHGTHLVAVETECDAKMVVAAVDVPGLSFYLHGYCPGSYANAHALMADLIVQWTVMVDEDVCALLYPADDFDRNHARELRRATGVFHA